MDLFALSLLLLLLGVKDVLESPALSNIGRSILGHHGVRVSTDLAQPGFHYQVSMNRAKTIKDSLI